VSNESAKRSAPPSNKRGGTSSGFGRWVTGLGRGKRIGLLVGAVVIVVVVAVVLAAVLTGGTTKGLPVVLHDDLQPRFLDHTDHDDDAAAHRELVQDLSLTGRAAPGDKVPQRAALAVKIGNDPYSRRKAASPKRTSSTRNRRRAGSPGTWPSTSARARL